MRSIIKLFKHVALVPIPLAERIGIEPACLFATLVRLYGDDQIAFIPTLYNESIINQLKSTGLLQENEIDGMYLDFGKLDEILEVQPIGPTPPFKNQEFISLCEKWRQILKSKNRNKSIQDIYNLFSGKTLEQSIESLKLTVSNQFVTLYVVNQTDSKKTGDRGRTWSGGGSANQGAEKNHDHSLVRTPE